MLMKFIADTYQGTGFYLGLHSQVVFILLIHVKMPTNVGILTFMSRINSWSFELSM